MQNRIEAPGSTGTRRDLSVALLGRLPVDYADGFGEARGRLDQVRAGLFVAATGTIQSLRLHGTPEEPRATLTLVSPTGESAIVAAGTDAYLEHCDGLVAGRTVRVHGTVVRPFKGMPPHIQLLSVHPA